MFERATSGVLVKNLLLYFAYADFEENRMKYEKVHSIYQKILDLEDVDPTLVCERNLSSLYNWFAIYVTTPFPISETIITALRRLMRILNQYTSSLPPALPSIEIQVITFPSKLQLSQDFFAFYSLFITTVLTSIDLSLNDFVEY